MGKLHKDVSTTGWLMRMDAHRINHNDSDKLGLYFDSGASMRAAPLELPAAPTALPLAAAGSGEVPGHLPLVEATAGPVAGRLAAIEETQQ
eukprot:3139909-Amphidinium_carterae.1